MCIFHWAGIKCISLSRIMVSESVVGSVVSRLILLNLVLYSRYSCTFHLFLHLPVLLGDSWSLTSGSTSSCPSSCSPPRCRVSRQFGICAQYAPIRGMPDPHWPSTWHCTLYRVSLDFCSYSAPPPATLDADAPNRTCCPPSAWGTHHDPWRAIFDAETLVFHRSWNDRSARRRAGNPRPNAYTALAWHWTPLGRPYRVLGGEKDCKLGL